MHLITYALLLALQQPSPRPSVEPAAHPSTPVVTSQQPPVAEALRVRADSHYVAILEKTNQQLSLWLNPYGLFIGALGVLFAIGAIVSGLLLFRQSGEYRRILARETAAYRDAIKVMVAERIAEMKDQVQQSLAANEERLATALEAEKASLKKQNEVLEARLRALRQAETSVATTSADVLLGPTGPTGPTGSMYFKLPGLSWPGSLDTLMMDPNVGSFKSAPVVPDLIPRVCSRCGGNVSMTPAGEWQCDKCGEVKPKS